MSSLLILVVCALTCLSQICQKKAAQSWAGAELSWKDKLLDAWFVSALLILVVAMMVWLYVLHLVPLSIAYPMLSISFVMVTIASHFVFGEHTSGRAWGGIALIILGTVLLGADL